MFRPQNKVPLEFRCPITFDIMDDPVEMDDKITYEKEAIVQWMAEHNNESPITHQQMSTNMRPNTALKKKIQDFHNNKKDNSGDQMQVFIKDIQDKTLLIVVNKNDTVGTLKTKIRDRNGIPENEQRLIYMAKQLNDLNKTIQDYEIKENSTIHLLMRMRGG